MIDIVLRRIEIKDFRGIKYFACDLTQDNVIEGDNATGKSSIFAAFTWCLFGKDEKDRKDFEIKPASGGVPVGHTQTSVELTLEINGEVTLLKREYYEKWVRHTGDDHDTYEGNETACWWNDAPVNVTEYGKRVAAVIDPQMFKMLTNPAYFQTMKWSDQREILLRLVHEATDEELAAGDKDILAMIAEMSGKTEKDFRAEKAAALKRLRKEKEGVEPRIDEVRKGMTEITFSEEYLRDEAAKADKEAEGINAELASLSQAQEAVLAQLKAKRDEIAETEAKAQQLVVDAKMAEGLRVSKANGERSVLQAEISALDRKLETQNNYIVAFVKQSDTYAAERDKLKSEHAELSGRYVKEASAEFSADGLLCPTCGRPMTTEQVKQAELDYNAAKAIRLEDIVKEGTRLKDRIEAAQNVLDEREGKLKAIEAERDADADKRMELQRRLSSMPEAEAEREIIAEEIPGWKELQQKAIALRQEMSDIERGGDGQEARSEASAKLKACMDRKAEIMACMTDLENNRKAEARIAELEEHGRELAQQIADYERMELAAKKLEKLRFEDVERKVNGLFHNVTFKLFDYTIEGKAVDTCVAVVGDALYPVANSAGKLNAGLDIIHTLSEHFGYRCPIFIDNAEGVTYIDGRGMQLVRMYVVKGSKLTVINQ
jgi:DNA repair exonuclease SbcCD ATPase subunit